MTAHLSNQRSKQGRVLGSPFKSPDNSVNNTSQNLFINTTQNIISSPTPARGHGKTKSVKIYDVIEENQEYEEEDTTKNEVTTPNSKEVRCTICNESMVSLYQLNKHIDDTHNNYTTTPTTKSSSLSSRLNSEPLTQDITKGRDNILSESEKSPSKRRSLKLDLLENNKGFSLSDSNNVDFQVSTSNLTVNELSKVRDSISRSHWKNPSSTNICSLPNCDKNLNVKNGIVNCRKCGDLFCNEHTNFKVKLKNSKNGPTYDSSKDGVWCRSCENCYFLKPDLAEGTPTNRNDLTSTFKQKRQVHVDNKLLARNKLQKKFIKLINLLTEQHMQKSNNSLWSFLSVKPANEIEKQVLGLENWEDDKGATHCSICFVKFSILIRKHHCRLCGRIVCDDSFGERKRCSILVPINKLLDKLLNLNYSPLVKNNLHRILNDDSKTIRCCIDCKNDILYDWKLENLKKLNNREQGIFNNYDSILIIKNQISVLLPKYKVSISKDDHDNINKIRNKLMNSLKDFENLTNQFKVRFFVKRNETLMVNEKYVEYSRLINNIHQSLIIFLQDNLLIFKTLNDEFKEKELVKLKNSEINEEQKPLKLTKKQIRELREQLMVMNEQKFIVENLINDYIKQRKFDELNALIENKEELNNIIKELEIQLGDFGF